MNQFPCTNPKCPNQWHYTQECPNLPAQSGGTGAQGTHPLASVPPPSTSFDEEREVKKINSLMDDAERAINSVKPGDYDQFFTDIMAYDGQLEADMVTEDGYRLKLVGYLDEDLYPKEVYLSGYNDDYTAEEEREIDDANSNVWDAMHTLTLEAISEGMFD